MQSEPHALPPAPAPSSPTRRLATLSFLVIGLAAGIVAYSNSFSVPLLLDDTASIAENPSIRKLWPLWAVLSPPGDVGLGGRPVCNVTFALNYVWGGTAVRGYHVVNLAIHLAAGLTLFGLIRRTVAQPVLQNIVPASMRDFVAGAGALLWLLHPLQTEAVTYLSQRSESLMGLFYLFTLYAFARGAVEKCPLWLALSVAACALGMATKEVMVTAPAIVLLYDRTFVSGSFAEAWRRHRRVHLALAATWVLLAILLADVHQRGVGYLTMTWWQYALMESRVVLHYLRLAFWPSPLVFDYGSAAAHSWSEAGLHVSACLLLVAAAGVALWRRPLIGFAAAWVFITLSPTSSVVPVAGQPMAEHRMYLPLVGIVAALAIAVAHRVGLRAFVTVAVIASAAAGYATHRRNHDYRSALALWSDTVAKVPHNARAHAGVGAAHLEQGNVAAAIPALQRALQLDPQLAEAHNNLATALIDAGRPADSLPHFETALKLRPGIAATHYNFGNVLLELGRANEAVAQQERALALQPDFALAECALGNALIAVGRVPEAIAHYRAALRLQPDLVAAHFALANALANSGRAGEAIPHYEATVRALPDLADAHFNLANAFAVSGRYPEAIEHYEITLKLRPDFARARANLDAVRAALRGK